MGWQDRDYAKFTDDEFAAIYGGARPVAAAPARRTSSRGVIWTLVAIAITAVSTFAWHERGITIGGPVDQGAPAVLYGTVVTSGPFAGNVCTEVEYLPATQGWRCDDYQVNSAQVPVYPATAYQGQCAHLKVEGRAWTCLSGTPVPPGATS